jgi:tetratricopeptide (TPR) repeat protein
MDSPDADTRLRARSQLGVLRLAEKKYAEARAAFQEVIDSGHPESAPLATANLGTALRTEGKFDEARRYYERAVAWDTKTFDIAPGPQLITGSVPSYKTIKDGRFAFYVSPGQHVRIDCSAPGEGVRSP